MEKKDLEKFKEALLESRKEFLSKLKNAQSKISDSFDENGGDEIDAASQTSEKEVFFELTANDKITVDAIDNALVKIEQGNYGRCECCGEYISIERLKVIPWGRYCIKCQEEAERPRL
ncbi:MAG: TraR/DksA family transcriptional regulator [Elusimicrobiota bacterium]|jgi:DnaK suppressor protein|nr:TraR/DksA family transcriptional regulator [Elusimicrobiota bacterium]